MSRQALILAAHGSHSDAGVNEEVRRCARRVADLTAFDEVVAAFHAGEPGFARALDGLEAESVTVVPLMTSSGYYCDVVLPRELGRSRESVAKMVRFTRPVGEHPRMAELIATLVDRRLDDDELRPRETSIVLVGHGTTRHARSRQATLDLAHALRGICAVHEVLTAFLDDVPGVGTVLGRATGRNVLVFPFLISGGWHATRDIPFAVGLADAEHARWPLRGTVNQRYVVCEPAIGTHPDIAGLAADLATASAAAVTLERLV